MQASDMRGPASMRWIIGGSWETEDGVRGATIGECGRRWQVGVAARAAGPGERAPLPGPPPQAGEEEGRGARGGNRFGQPQPPPPLAGEGWGGGIPGAATYQLRTRSSGAIHSRSPSFTSNADRKSAVQGKSVQLAVRVPAANE